MANSKNKGEKKSKVVVAVSGGFDPIHIGHIRLFKEAKKLGDELVVILNNDNWLRAKKGYVFMPEDERKEVIESIKYVDRVILTKHEPNPKDMSVCRELEELKPHIFANGGDRFKNNIPEVETCEKIGCKMVFDVGEGGKVQSSSWLVNKCKILFKADEYADLLLNKKVIIFDLDGTLTESKSYLDTEMASLLCELLERRIVAIIGGGNYNQFKEQLLKKLNCASKNLKNLFILPTSGSKMYKFSNGKWKIVYKKVLTSEEKSYIISALKKALEEVGYKKPKKTYGKLIEDRESQITFSALGQKAPLWAKEEWHKEHDIRPKLKSVLEKYLPDFEIRIGGLTSIDITKKGIDKAYGIEQISKILSIPVKDMVYIGDALFEGGNDSAVFKTKIDTVQILGPDEVKCLLYRFFKKLKE
ncbi:Glycerol-3-phosphate cytidylyltransferase [bacterium HR34]|nr:Glycerol-3-phosphate cytidylyltransferase [bacterium HR34]